MRKPVLPEESYDRPHSFFELPEFGALAPADCVALQTTTVERNTLILDKLLSGIKWTFLYIPGVAGVHMISMMFAFLLFYQDHFPAEFIGAFGTWAICSFMIMLGIGKLSDLRYLRVVGVVTAMSVIATILYSIVIALGPGNYFGTFMMITMLVPLFAGILFKRKLDREIEQQESLT